MQQDKFNSALVLNSICLRVGIASSERGVDLPDSFSTTEFTKKKYFNSMNKVRFRLELPTYIHYLHIVLSPSVVFIALVGFSSDSVVFILPITATPSLNIENN